MTLPVPKSMKIILKKFSTFKLNQMKKILLIVFVSLSVACNQTPKKKKVTAEAAPAQNEWVDLFDGVSFKG